MRPRPIWYRRKLQRMQKYRRLIQYARPLIEGEVKPAMEGGLPKYAAFEKQKVDKLLPPRA